MRNIYTDAKKQQQKKKNSKRWIKLKHDAATDTCAIWEQLSGFKRTDI